MLGSGKLVLASRHAGWLMTETTISAHRDEQQQVMLAMILMILAMLLLPAIDAIAKDSRAPCLPVR